MAPTEIWAKHFESAFWTGARPGEGDFWPGDLSPERLILNLVWVRLWRDPLLRSIFGRPNIEMMDVRNILEFRHLPRLQLYLGNLDESQEPTTITRNHAVIYVAIRYEADFAYKAAKPGACGVDSVLRHIRTIMINDQTLTTNLTGHSGSVPMAIRADQEGGINFILEPDATGQRAIVTQELQWNYQLAVDSLTGQIENAQYAVKP